MGGGGCERGCWIFGWAEKNKKVLNLTRAAGKIKDGGENDFFSFKQKKNSKVKKLIQWGELSPYIIIILVTAELRT